MSGASLAELESRFPATEVQRQLATLQRYRAAIDDPELWLRTALEHHFQSIPIETVERCYCGNSSPQLCCRFVFWSLMALRQCTECGLIFVSPRLTSESMARIFNEHYFQTTDPEFWGARREPVFREVLGLLQRHGCRNVLDVGAAYGHFLTYAERHGLEAVGCDVSATAVAWGRRHLDLDLRAAYVADAGLPESSFDSVVSLDALYYAPDPLADLRAMRRLLRPGGVLVLRLRNGLKTLAMVRGRDPRAIAPEPLPAGHLWAFTPRAIARLVGRAGMEVVALEPATYSRVKGHALLALWTTINRQATRRLGAAIHTQSFNLVARRPLQ